MIPWSPLARGFLAGGRGQPGRGQHRARPHRRVLARGSTTATPDHAVVDAGDRGRQGARRLQHAGGAGLGAEEPGITAPIIGTSKAHHLDDAVAALEIKLTDDEVKALEAPYKPKPVLDHL